MRLFVIGNGFDIEHGLKSEFKDFKEYLEQSYLPTFNRDYIPFPNVCMDNDGTIVADSNNAVQILYSLVSHIPISSDWNDFERCLGELNYQEVLDLVEKDDDNPFHYYYNLEDLIGDLKISLKCAVLKVFCEWVNDIDVSTVIKRFAFREDDLFLTFNYTSILEDVYSVLKDNVCHIHGSCRDSLCIAGHFNTERGFDDYDDIISMKINDIHNSLTKPVTDIYLKQLPFFERLYEANITEIVFFGFSFNSIDMYYINKLFANININSVSFYLSEYEDCCERDKLLTILNRFGIKDHYKGCFCKKSSVS